MAPIRIPKKSLLVVVAFSRHVEALRWAQERLEQIHGPLAFCSVPFEFEQTRYYEASMGTELRRLFFVFNDLVESDCLPFCKRQSNAIEEELAESGRFAEERPLNLDPGILQLGKFLLATTKDQAHRIYLYDGIFAEVTLRFQDGEFHPWPWTYPSYCRPEVRAFLKESRDFYRQQLIQECPEMDSSGGDS